MNPLTHILPERSFKTEQTGVAFFSLRGGRRRK
jgi:hypothetical protein